MQLSTAAGYFNDHKFSTYDRLTNTWDLDELSGRITPVDRFLSNFSRPLHRRMFVCDLDTVIPESSTIRSEVTGDIYVVGQGRYDSQVGNTYQALYMLHLVNGLAGGLGTLTRKSVQGPSNDPGHLVESEIGSYYMDLELRATTPETGTVQQTAGQYFIMAPPECPMQEWDFIELNGVSYKVEESYFDSGMKFSRVLQTQDNRVNIQYLKTVSFSYDSSSGTSQDVPQSYNVSGTVHQYSKVVADPDNVSENVFNVVIAATDIGFDPTPRESVIVDSNTHVILKAARDPLTKEWVLTCQA